jgi:adenosylcobinamide-GDP ribazoletransferase
MKRQFSLFLVAVQFLTRLPVPHFVDFQPNWLAQSVRYFPLVAALLGWISVGVWRVSTLCFPPVVAVGMMIGAMLLLTGAFHEDGFADVCDGFGGGATRDAVLSIMKDSRIGAFGAIGIGMMLALKWATLVSLPRAAFPVTVIGAQMVSRWCAIGHIWRLQYVRTDADAKSKPLAGGLGSADWLLSGALGALAWLPAALLIDPAAGIAWGRALLAGLACAVAGGVFAGVYFKTRIGGYTGDCLGAAQQIAELGFLLAALGTLAAPQ